jgi:hypothetical protein
MGLRQGEHDDAARQNASASTDLPGSPYDLADVMRIIRRAEAAGIDPRRVALALGVSADELARGEPSRSQRTRLSPPRPKAS